MPADLAVPAVVAPAYLAHPAYAETLGPEVADLGAEAGFAPDPEQRLALDLIFALDQRGRSAAFEFAVICSRQNLKTGLFKLAALGWLYLTDQRLVVWSAHEFSTAQEAFRDMIALVEGSRYLERRVKAIHRSNGDEAIELAGGQRLKFKARTKAGGRGLTGDKVVLDEAFALQAPHMGALLPTLSAVPDPQVLYGSSAGLADSKVLRGVRNRGRAGGDPRLAYAEWCDDLPGSCEQPRCTHEVDAEGCRLDDRARWRRANPALGRRITEDYIAAERRALPPAEFARERLGWWEEDGQAWEVFPEATWRARLVEPVRPPRIAVGVAASWPTASHWSVGIAGTAQGRLVVQLVDRQPGRGWVRERLRQLREDHDPVAVAMRDKGPTAAMHAEMSQDGFEFATPWAKESAAGFAMLYDAVMTGEPLPFGHFGQPDLDAAVAAGQRRAAGDGSVWECRGDADVGPIEAATNAVWAWLTYGTDESDPSAYII